MTNSGHHIDPAVLAKVRALLAKAESTTFPEEADAFMAKAQELMTRHAIDRLMLDEGAAFAAGPIGARIVVESPYAGAKSLLVGAIANANRCRAVWESGVSVCTVFGYEGDVETVELLFSSLLVQATAAMVKAEREVARPARGTNRTRSFRYSFYVAFASRIGQRLREASEATIATAVAEGGSALLPALARQSDAVEAALRRAIPHITTRRVVAHNAAGWVAGQAAAETANLSPWEEVKASA